MAKLAQPSSFARLLMIYFILPILYMGEHMTDIQHRLPSKYALNDSDDWISTGTKLQNRIEELEILVKELESRLNNHINYGNHIDNGPIMYGIKQ
jgi:hypothetical protein